MKVAEQVFGPIAALLDSLAYIGVNSHVIKLDYVVRNPNPTPNPNRFDFG
jgi:hypothetical protein